MRGQYMDINIIVQLTAGILIIAIFVIIFAKRSKKEGNYEKRLFRKLLALSGIVVGASILLNALCVIILGSGALTVDALFDNESAYSNLLMIASLAIMLCIAYFQYLLQQQDKEQNAKDLFAQSMIDISQFECFGELLNYNIENCKSVYFDGFDSKSCPLLIIRFGDACLKNYIEITDVKAKLSSKDKPDDSESEENVSSELSDNCIKLLLIEKPDIGIENELINNILLAPYSVPFVKLPEFKVTLILSFVDHRYLDEQTDIHKLKLTLTFTFEPYEEYGTSKMKIIAKQIKAAN